MLRKEVTPHGVNCVLSENMAQLQTIDTGIALIVSLVTTLSERETRGVRNAFPGNIATMNSFQNAKSARKEKLPRITSPIRATFAILGVLPTESETPNAHLAQRVDIKTNWDRRRAPHALLGRTPNMLGTSAALVAIRGIIPTCLLYTSDAAYE